MKRFVSVTCFLAVVLAIQVTFAWAQTTEFTYQGQLQSSAAPANGNFDFEFLLFDAVSGGAQVGTTVTRSSVAVASGTFAVKLDFGSQFPGANRFLEIRVRQTGGGAFTPLSPRQSVGSTPYAVQSLNATNATTANSATNATQLGGVGANQFVVTGDSRLSDARNPLPGSANYVQNQNGGPQATTNFNISGNGSAGGALSGGYVNAVTEFRINQSRILGNAGTHNLFAGETAGFANTTGAGNSFFGNAAGFTNTTGAGNSFFGHAAGFTNATAANNSFFGTGAGFTNTAANNSFFGWSAGFANQTGEGNAFFGSEAGKANTAGGANSFFGYGAGRDNTGVGNTFSGFGAGVLNNIGNLNSFFGTSSGNNNTTGLYNSFYGSGSGSTNVAGNGNTAFGFAAGFAADNLTNATAIGFRSQVNCSNCMVLGGINTVNGATANTNVGIGTTAPTKRLVVGGGTGSSGVFNNGIFVNIPGGAAITARDSTGGVEVQINAESSGLATVGTFTNHPLNFRTNNSEAMRIDTAGNVGIGTNTPNGRLDVNGTIRVATLDTAGGTSLCLNSSNKISTCSSSARYKNNINAFTSGLSLTKQLRPVSFNWKEGGLLDMGLVAEEVNAVEPLLTTTNANGEVEGVKYDRIGVVLVNAVKDQQAQIEAQTVQIEQQRIEIEKLKTKVAEVDELKALVCSIQPSAAICKR